MLKSGIIAQSVPSGPEEIAVGRAESVTGGTGAYAGVTGHSGTFSATIDYITGAGIGVFEAKVQLP